MYIFDSQRNGTLYIGVSSDLVNRIWQHKNHQIERFASCRDIHLLAYFELHADMLVAITREKQIKNGIVHGKFD